MKWGIGLPQSAENGRFLRNVVAIRERMSMIRPSSGSTGRRRARRQDAEGDRRRLSDRRPTADVAVVTEFGTVNSCAGSA